MVLKRRKLIKRISAIASVVLLLFTFCVSVSGAEYFDSKAQFAYPIYKSSNDATPMFFMSQTVSIGDRINFVPMYLSGYNITTSDGSSRIYSVVPIIRGKQTLEQAITLFQNNTAANNDNWMRVSATRPFFTTQYFDMYLGDSSDYGIRSQPLVVTLGDYLENVNHNRYLPYFVIDFAYIDENGDYVSGVTGVPNSGERADWYEFTYSPEAGTVTNSYEIDTTVLNLSRPELAVGIDLRITIEYYADNAYYVLEGQPEFSQPYEAHFHFFFEEWDIQKAYSDGYRYGKDYGEFIGEEVGFQRGYREAAEELVNYNAVSGLIQIAQLPSVFISSMLDFNVFGINILALVKHLFTCLLVAFVVVVFVRFIL